MIIFFLIFAVCFLLGLGGMIGYWIGYDSGSSDYMPFLSQQVREYQHLTSAYCTQARYFEELAQYYRRECEKYSKEPLDRG